MRFPSALSTPSRCLRMAFWLALCGLCGCQSLPEVAPTQRPSSAQTTQASASTNVVRYIVDPVQTDIRFLVFKAGALARLGHNHVVQAQNVQGEILLAEDLHQSSLWIDIPVKDFQVDRPTLRLDEGEAFRVQPDAAAIAGTTQNMLGPLELDAERYPLITIRSVALNGPRWGLDVTVRILLHGTEREIVVPVAVAQDAGQLVATAIFSIRQTDFGITPLSVFGGALSVEDAIRIRMRLVARSAAVAIH